MHGKMFVRTQQKTICENDAQPNVHPLFRAKTAPWAPALVYLDELGSADVSP